MLYFLSAFFLSLLLTFLIRKVALRFSIVDKPDGGRHLHEKPTPLLGGVAIFIAFWTVISYIVLYHPIQGIERIDSALIAAFVSSFIILLVGIADDIYHMSAKFRLFVVALPILLFAVDGSFSGLIKILNNPFGGYIELTQFALGVVIFCWLMGTTYTVKILDGLDGLATGVVAIGAFVIYLLTSITKFYQPNVSLVALIFLGVCLGFLVFNFYPAKIFLGESGSMLLGFMIGVLAIIGGGKLATALLVMAIPVFDLIRVIYIRVRRGQPIFTGDREHLHFRLVDAGFSQRKAVGLLYFMAILFGLSTLFLQSLQKFYALLFLVILMAVASHLIGRKKI